MPKRGVLWSLSQITTDLGVRLDDAAHTRWSATQKNMAVKSSVLQARGRWWEERLDDTQTYDAEDYRYNLPPACEEVSTVYFAALSDGDPRYFVPPSRWHLEGTELVFDKSIRAYDGQTLYIYYTVYYANLLSVTAADGVAASTAFSSATSTFVTSGVQEGDEVEISGDSGGPYYVSSVTSNTALVLHKAPTAGTSLTFYVAYYTDLPYEYLIYAAMAELYEMASRNRPGVEVEENVQWATYYRQLAGRTLVQQARHPKQQRRY